MEATIDSASHSVDDLERLRGEYANRSARLAHSDLYFRLNPAHLFMIQGRQRATAKLLRSFGFTSLADKRILEVGCGNGNVLHEYLGYGAAPQLLHGLELLPERLLEAHAYLPHVQLTLGDGQNLPYDAGVFDLVIQHTVFSSILDERVKTRIAQEMLRVLRRDGGLLIWYDFWLNPKNPNARGIRPAEIRRLFPGCPLVFKRVTLAPPIVRRLIRVSWGLCTFVEGLTVLNSHYLVAISVAG